MMRNKPSVIPFARTEILHCSLILIACFVQGFSTSDVRGEDPFTAWMNLSENQKAEVEKVLTVALPNAIPEAQPYADALANDIPRWVGAVSHLEQGNYVEIIGSFDKELQGFVGQYVEERLPEDSMALWSFNQIKDNSAIVHQVFLAMADPSKSWDDVEFVFWKEVGAKVQDESNRILEKFVRDCINDLAGTSEQTVFGFTAGDLYILAIREWADEVGTWDDRVERTAANELYRIYQRDRMAGGKQAAEGHITEAWSTLRPLRDDGSFGPMNLSLTLVPLGQRLGVGRQDYNELARRLLSLCDKFWETPEGRIVYTDEDKTRRNIYYRFHEWLMKEAARKVQAHRVKHQKEAEEQFRLARQRTQERLADIHRRAARELCEAIEKQLTEEDKKARDAAIGIAEQLLKELADDVDKAQREKEPFRKELDKLQDVTGRAASVQDVFDGGLTDELTRIKEDIAEIGRFAGLVEQRLAALYAELEGAEPYVESAEQAAQETCNAAKGVRTAPSKEAAFKHVEEAVRQASAATSATERANPGLFLARHQARELDQFLKQRDRQDYGDMATLRGLHWNLSEIDTALKTWEQYRQLETDWMNLFGALTARVSQHRILQNKCRRTADYIQALLAPHNPNGTTIAILATVEDLRRELDKVQLAIVTTWDEHWAWRSFPKIDLPTPGELQAARQLCETHRNLIKPAGAKLDAIDVRVRRLEGQVEESVQRAADAKHRADLCLAKALFDYDRIWLKGNNTDRIVGRGNPPDGPDAELPPGEGEVTVYEPDAELPPGDGEITMTQPDAELPPAEGEVTVHEPDAELPPGDGEVTMNQPDAELPPGEGEVAENEPGTERPPTGGEVGASQTGTTQSSGSEVGPNEVTNAPNADDFDGRYTIYESASGAGRRTLAQPFESMSWKADGRTHATVTFVVASRFPDQALQMAGVRRNVTATATLLKDSQGTYYYVVGSQQLTQTVTGIARLAAMIGAGAGEIFGGGNPANVQATVKTAAATIVPSGNGLNVTVHTDLTLHVGNTPRRVAKTYPGFAVHTPR